MSEEFYIAAYIDGSRDDTEREIEVIENSVFLEIGSAKHLAQYDNDAMHAAGAGPEKDCKVFRLVEVHEYDRQ